jgi:DNA polymerase-1
MKVLLLDAYNLIHRARSGFTQGEYAVVYNFLRSIRPIIEKFSPEKVYFVLEGNPAFRRELSAGRYKENRPSLGDSFHRQKAAIINVASSILPFTVIRHPDLECDDTIATMVSKHLRDGDECTVVSSDTDFIQLLNIWPNLQLYNPIKKKFVETPDYDYVTWKALRGDPTDNISGIPGVGDKTALKLVKGEHKKTLNEYLLDDEKMRIFEKNVNLIRLVDFSNDLSMLEYTKGHLDKERLYELFLDLGFKSMTKEKTWQNYIKTFEGIA